MKTITLPLILFLLVTAGAIRIYQAHRFFYYDGDQSNDVAAVKRLAIALREHQWDNLSPVGQEGVFYYLPAFPQPQHQRNVVYNGAAYYYVLLPAGILSSFHPYGIVLFLVFLSIAATFSLYVAGRLLVDHTTGIVAATVHAVSFVILTYSRFIWTPSPVVSLSAIAFAAFVAVLRGHVRFWMVLAAAVSLATQIHNSGYLLGAFVLTLIIIFRPKLPSSRSILLGTLLVFIIPLLPTLWNETQTGYLLPRAIIYQLTVHFSRAYAGLLPWHIPFVLVRDISHAFAQFMNIVLFVGDLAHKFAPEYQFFLRLQVFLWTLGGLLLVLQKIRARASWAVPRPILLFSASIFGWAAIGAWLAQLYYRSDSAIFWLNGVSAFIPLTLFVFALFIRISWQNHVLRIPLVVTLVSFAFLQGMATINTFWENTDSDIMYEHQAQALRRITSEQEDQPYALRTNSYSPALSFVPILALEHIPQPRYIYRIYTCTTALVGQKKLPVYTLIFFPNDGSPTTTWLTRHSGEKIFQSGQVSVYRQ